MGDVPAIGYSITANIGDDRQVVFQHFVGSDETDASVNAALDRIMGLIDRQKARAALPGLLAERRKLVDENAQYEQDRAEAELNYQKAQAALETQLVEAGEAKKEAMSAGYSQHVQSGRTGEYKPKGAVAASITAAERVEKELKAAMDKNTAERDQHIENMRITMDRRVARIALLDEQIAENEKKAG